MSEAELLRCPSCGSAVQPEALVCWLCRYKLRPHPALLAAASPPGVDPELAHGGQARRRNPVLVGLGIAGAVVVAVLLAIILATVAVTVFVFILCLALLKGMP